MKVYETELFESYGVVQKEYVTVPNSLLANTKELKKFGLMHAEEEETEPTGEAASN